MKLEIKVSYDQWMAVHAALNQYVDGRKRRNKIRPGKKDAKQVLSSMNYRLRVAKRILEKEY